MCVQDLWEKSERERKRSREGECVNDISSYIGPVIPIWRLSVEGDGVSELEA